jgi:hypothetical protein
MEATPLTCKDEARRLLAREKRWTGIDFVEVINDQTQLHLCVHFFGEIPEGIAAEDIRIEGGLRVRDIRVDKLEYPQSNDPEKEDCLRVTVDRPGDFSIYTLRIPGAEDCQRENERFPNFDPRYSSAEFSFKVGCPSELDCKSAEVCPPEKHDEPEINYLAKDYATFRQLILDRLSLLMPDWQERHVPDIGIALVELLAYVADYLSYYQDAVATEAYLGTARKRISVRRHARLVDYHMHEGCNARTWITIETTQDVTDSGIKLCDVFFTTSAGDNHEEVFEPLAADLDAPLQLYALHSTLYFYTWGNEECCLPRGATQATLKYDRTSPEEPVSKPSQSDPSTPPSKPAERTSVPDSEVSRSESEVNLKVGDILIFEEVKGPKTGNASDADISRRWAVRLTKVEEGFDPLRDQPIVEIEWQKEDALPFPFCISARLPAPDCTLVEDISVARGNVILVDHGETVDEPEELGQVEEKGAIGECACEGSAVEVTYLPDTFEPVLKQTPLTFSEPLAKGSLPASSVLKQDARKALPQFILTGLPGLCQDAGDQGEPKAREGIDAEDPEWKWYPQTDLLSSEGGDQDFVVEVDDDGYAHLRFGDGDVGRMPEACTIFTARYRVGNGPAGNVGADMITKINFRNQSLSGLTLNPRNPLPAQGGTAPESIAEVKLFAPGAFRKELQRAIVADDYAQIVEREFSSKIQGAGASLQWTGSWYEAQVAVDPFGSEVVDERLRRQVEGRLHRYRRMGHDVKVHPAGYVPLDIELQVCVLPHYLRGQVEAALLDLLSDHRLPDGTLGFFHPDNLTFGEGIYVSKLVAAVQAVPGVESVRVTAFERAREGDQGELEAGVLPLGPLEVAQLDNDPNFPEHGTLKLVMGGGR